MKYVIVKIVLLLLLIAYPTHLIAQNESTVKRPFLRVFDTEGKKISKGRLLFFNDSIIFLKHAGSIKEVHFSKIGYIKTRRSLGNNVLKTSLIGGGVGAAIGFATSSEETKTRTVPIVGEYEYTTGTSPGTGAAIGGGIGLAGGALIGLGSSLFKKSITYPINGNQRKWLDFKRQFTTVIEN